jgi:hypothetical protein
MGNLIHALRACALIALLVMSGDFGAVSGDLGAVEFTRPAPGDPNDHVWLARFDPPLTTGTVSPTEEVPGGFRTAVVSWNVTTPRGSWVEAELRARVDGRWTKWYVMGRWSSDGQGDTRQSVAHQQDGDGDVDTDTLELKQVADAFEVRVAPFPARDQNDGAPKLMLLAVATSLGDTGESARPSHLIAASELAVPERTQRVAASPDAKGGGGDSWCSPASMSMVMAYWAQQLNQPQWDVDVASLADGVYDPVYDGCGNWPFNVAFASERGLAGWVRQFPSLDDVALLVSRGIPVIASIAVKPGELDGAPYPKTAGHLLVIRGFTAAGDVIVNDPYGHPGEIRRVYRRDQFAHAWLGGSNGTVYLIAPPARLNALR